jgi:hypothetical protein
MFRDNTVVRAGAAKPDVKEIDRKLRDLAQQQAALDADEAHWLRIADAQNAWPALGYVHALEYLEDVFGYAPRTAMERMRVARELGALPQLEDALRVGELSYSAVRELTRVATPETVDRWIEEARGHRFRDVEQMVSGRHKGDNPDAPPDPALVKHRLVLELDGQSLAIWRQMRQVLELELDRSLDDRSLVLTLGERWLREGAAANDGRAKESVDRGNAKKPSTAPPYMIHLMTCRGCGETCQDGGGLRLKVDKSVLERAQCNAIICDDEHGKRAKRTPPAAIERQVLERAQHRCQVPGCRSSKHLTIHHIIFWSHGGTHDPSNLIVLCDGHHRVLHEGHLSITGRAPDELVFTRNGQRLLAANEAAAIGAEMRSATPQRNAKQAHAVRRHVNAASKQSPAAPALDEDITSLAYAALCQLGFKAAIASRAVELARGRVRADAELAELIKESLRHCS